jgi:hypothetical protein
MKLTFKEAEQRYGKIINNKWPDEVKWCVIYKTPKWFSDQVINSATNKPCTKIYMNKDMVPMFEKALKLLVDRSLTQELKTMDGCFMIRSIRGMTSKVSAHSYAIAIDLNAKENPLGGPVKFSNEFLQCFKEAGFTLGADFSRLDGQHFSLGW